MTAHIYWLFFLILLSLFAVFLFIVFRHPGKVEGRREKNPAAVRLGAILQSLSYMTAWTLRRPEVVPFGAKSLWPLAAVAVLSLAAAVGAIALVTAAKKHLGRQWALAARVVEGHKLVTDGPFGVVRHPIYLAMGLLLLSPVIGFSSWLGAGLSIILFVAGTVMRVRAEEAVLTQEFGGEYAAYKERVPAFLPRLG
jgi:protein-S-isoprenylcysteine O-methyltransferase Ste14